MTRDAIIGAGSVGRAFDAGNTVGVQIVVGLPSSLGFEVLGR